MPLEIERPAHGLGHYLRDVVYGALDGVITTLAVVSATSGAALDPKVGLVLGMANLAADGLSMGASNYLGLKSELEQRGATIADEAPWRHGLATSIAFATVGAVPLLAYVLPRPSGATVLQTSIVLAALALGAAGTLRSRFTKKAAVTSAVEMLAIGLAASGVAYAVGALTGRLLD